MPFMQKELPDGEITIAFQPTIHVKATPCPGADDPRDEDVDDDFCSHCLQEPCQRIQYEAEVCVDASEERESLPALWGADFAEVLTWAMDDVFALGYNYATVYVFQELHMWGEGTFEISIPATENRIKQRALPVNADLRKHFEII